MAGRYCTESDVRRILQTFDFTESTTPTKKDVKEAIREATDHIDNETHHAWREISVSNEFYDLPVFYGCGWSNNDVEIFLKHREIRSFDATEGDKIEIWNGSDYDDWLSTKTEGRADDFWIDHGQGVFYLKYFLPWFRKRALRLTYRYGNSSIPSDIRKIAAQIAAIPFIQSDDRSSMLNETGDPTRMSHSDKIEKMEKNIAKTIRKRSELPIV